MLHELKTLPKYFNAVLEGDKPFEVRKDDRDFQTEDYVNLKEWNEEFTGRNIVRQITYILGRNEDEKIYVPDGYVILGLSRSDF